MHTELGIPNVYFPLCIGIPPSIIYSVFPIELESLVKMIVSHDQGSTPPDPFIFRMVRPSDYEDIRSMHRSLFPLQYSDEFLRNACDGVGLQGGSLFSSVVTLRGDVDALV